MGQYKRLYLGGATTLLGLFALLMSIGFSITDLSGDFECAGTLEDPCKSEMAIKNPTPKNVYIYNKDEVSFNFSKEPMDYAFFIEDGRCSGKLTGSSCSCYVFKNKTEIAYKGWRCVDFITPKKDRKYVHLFPRYSNKDYMLVGFKNNQFEELEWAINIDLESENEE